MFAGVDVSMVDDQLASSCAADAVILLQEAKRSQNRCAAATVFTAARLFTLRRSEIAAERHGVVFGHIGDKGATIEVATALKISTGVASSWIEVAFQLDGLPDLRAAFYRGDVDLARVRTIADTVADLDELPRKIMESAGLAMAEQAMSTHEMRDRLDSLLIEIDPELAAAERTEFERHQNITIRPDRHGHSTISGLTNRLCDADPRTPGQRWVGAVRAMARRHEAAGDGARRRGHPGRHDRGVGALHRWSGPDRSRLRTPARRGCDMAGLVRRRHHPHRDYRQLRHGVLSRKDPYLGDIRDGFDTCDIDHVIPFDHANPSAGGWTVRMNLEALCRLHHHAKTVGLRRAHMHDDRSITWTSTTTGEQFTTYPEHV